MVKLSIIVPAYNEARYLPVILAQVQRVLQTKVRSDFEIIIVNDGSTDETYGLLQKYARKAHHRVFHHPTNKGKGAALRTGYMHATGDFILIQDADLEYNPDDYPKLVKPLFKYQAQVVYGSRFLGKKYSLFGKKQVFLPSHYLGNKVLIFLTNMLYGSHLTDMETCYKAFTRNVLSNLKLQIDGFGETPEFTAKVLKRGYKIHEVPIRYTSRTYEEGKKVRWKDGFFALWYLIKYRFVE